MIGGSTVSDDRAQWWRIAVTLERIPTVPAAEFAVFPNDPTPQFRADLERMEARLEGATTRSEGGDAVRRRLTAVWNTLFRSVRGDQVYVVTPTDPSGQTAATTAVESNDVGGERWLVTKAVNSRGRALCWCLPFAGAGGASTRLTLGDRNALDLAAVAAGE